MNTKLNEINEIIRSCDTMIEYLNTYGIIHTGHSEYERYKELISEFFRSHKLTDVNYAPYAVLSSLYFNSGSYTVNMNEAKMIRKTVVELKHELYPNDFERIFISHREKDKKQVEAFMELLYAIGIARPTEKENPIFCTSHPATYIENGKRNLDEIKNCFHSHQHTFYILWYSDNYFESQACLNEAGAIWVTNQRYQEILSPNFEKEKIGGMLDKQPIWFYADNKFRLNTFKEQTEKMFGLEPITPNAWEPARDNFINKISALVNKGDKLHAHS